MPPKLTEGEFIRRSQEVFGDRWGYDSLQYTTLNSPVVLRCPEHGEFSQQAARHLRGEVGCRPCLGIPRTTDEFVSMAREVWGSRWDYSSTSYVGKSKKVTLRCVEHGEFTQISGEHLKGRVGCRRCNRKEVTTSDFISEARKNQPFEWDYSVTQYLGYEAPVTLVCTIHGAFQQQAGAVLQGRVGCSGCKRPAQSLEVFLSRLEARWGDRWKCDLSSYQSITTKATFDCPEHGPFEQLPDALLQGKIGCLGCVNTGTSEPEEGLAEYLAQSLPSEEMLRRNREALGNGKELDMYIPSRQLAVELNGLYWHSEKFRTPEYHAAKFRDAEAVGIRLLQVWEDDWRDRPEVVKAHLLQVLGESQRPKISGRNTEVVEISGSEARAFLERNHIQGGASASVHLSLQAGGEVVAVASFKRRGEDYELVRYATSATVRGGHSKLVAHFERRYEYRQLVTFADLTFSSGELYRNTGWTQDAELPPDYTYLHRGRRHHKFNFRKDRFKRDPALKFREGLTERELAKMNGLLRVYDAGKLRFVRPHPVNRL